MDATSRRATLVERDVELQALRRAVAASTGDERCGQIVLVEGPPGIGKTELLLAACAHAQTHGVRVVRARGEPLEREFAHGVTRQLLRIALPALTPDERVDVLSGPAGVAALALTGGSGLALTGEPDTSAALNHGLYWLFAGLAESRPLLLAVDDVHWSDEPSLRFLATLARRLADLPMTLLLSGRPASLPASTSLNSMFAVSGVRLLRPLPLTAVAVGGMLEARLGTSSGEDVVALAHARTGGNPLLVRELISALAGRTATSERIAAIAPRSVARLVRSRLDELEPAARAVAVAVAVLGDGAALREVAALAEIELVAAADLTTKLVGADILTDDASPAFRHPLVRDAVLDDLAKPLRRAAHRCAAAVLRDYGAQAERIAAQLVVGETAGEAWAVEALCAAAAQALERGASDIAADLLLRARDEPPGVEERPAVLAQLGVAELNAGRPTGLGHLRWAMGAHFDARERARLAMVLGVELAGMQREREAAAVFAEGLALARDIDRQLALRLEAHLAHAERYDLTREQTGSSRLADLAAGLAGATPAERFVTAMDAALRPAANAAEAARLAAHVEAAWSEGLLPIRAATGAIATYLHAGELTRADAFAQTMLEHTRRRGLAFGHARASAMAAMVALAAGRLSDADAFLVATVETDTNDMPRPSVALLIEILVETDRLGEADALLARRGATGALPEKMLMNQLLWARARLHAACDRRGEALDDLFELGRRYARWGLASRPSPPWRGLAAALLARAGETERGRELALEELRLARTWGSERAIGCALRAVGTVEHTAEPLIESVRRLSSTPFRLDHAYALVELGAVHRHAGQHAAAIETLNLGMDLAHSCGASAVAERARTELLACGARPRRLARTGRDALTAGERRVALLAADRLTNRQIAQALFITTATVETHLRRTFRKLDVRAREEIAAQL